MTAAATRHPPLSHEGFTFWRDLIEKCERYTAAMNAAISERGLAPDQRLECHHDRELQISKIAPPAIKIRLDLDFFSWGPIVRGKITGQEGKDREFCLEEWEIPIAQDLDGSVIAIFDQGRSFSAQDLACYVLQAFRPCYPDLSLACERQTVVS